MMAPTPTTVPQLRVRIDASGYAGIWVSSLTDTRKGFIRRREISWDKRTGIHFDMPQPGDEITVAVLGEDEARNSLDLSIRALRDPWVEAMASQKYVIGQHVRAEIVNISGHAAYAQIEPGIDAIIHPVDIVIADTERALDSLWVGDHVAGIITSVIPNDRLLQISLRNEAERLKSMPNQRDARIEFFEDDIRHALDSSQSAYSKPERIQAVIGVRHVRPIPRPKRFLVVDDDLKSLDRLTKRLQDTYGVPVDCASSGIDAAKHVQQGVEYGLVLIDVRLKGERGIAVAQHLRLLSADLPVLFISNAATGSEELIGVLASGIPFARKEWPEIFLRIEQLCEGYVEPLSSGYERMSAQQDNYIQQFQMLSSARRPLSESVKGILWALKREAAVTQAVVFEMDSDTHRVSVLSSTSLHGERTERTSVTGLYYSEVRDVIEDEREFQWNSFRTADEKRFKNLFPYTYFNSCIGIPIQIPDHVTRHALFLFDDRIGRFHPKNSDGQNRANLARLAAQSIAVTIERSMLLDYMRQYEAGYTRGQFFDDLVHEARNKLGGVQSEVERLLSLSQSEEQYHFDFQRRQEWLQKIVSLIHSIADEHHKLGDLLNAYQQSSAKEMRQVDANAIVMDVGKQLMRMADSEGVTVEMDLANDLPPAIAVQSSLQQVLANLVLNAVQQIKLRKTLFPSSSSTGQGSEVDTVDDMVIVKTQYCHDSQAHPVCIQVIDSGPGIHWQLQSTIFAMGYSSRGGAGRGLPISRDLVESMGGHLMLAASYMFIGSAFLVMLQIANAKE